MPSMKSIAVSALIALAVVYASNKIAFIGKLAGK